MRAIWGSPSPTPCGTFATPRDQSSLASALGAAGLWRLRGARGLTFATLFVLLTVVGFLCQFHPGLNPPFGRGVSTGSVGRRTTNHYNSSMAISRSWDMGIS